MPVTVFPPLVDFLLAGVGLAIVAFWTGVFLLAGVSRLLDRLALSSCGPVSPAELPPPGVAIGALEEEVATP